jgi:hypothetical protein
MHPEFRRHFRAPVRMLAERELNCINGVDNAEASALDVVTGEVEQCGLAVHSLQFTVHS